MGSSVVGSCFLSFLSFSLRRIRDLDGVCRGGGSAGMGLEEVAMSERK